MPFKSEKQRRWMHANKPEMAMRWEHEYGSTPRTSSSSKRDVHGKLRRKRRRH